jgi:ADP-ribose pyrophosphatase YjhB (NUDIX family)
MTTRIEQAIATLTEAVPNPHAGLPEAVFYYVSRTTPLINVDLLIKDDTGRTLLAWRDDPFVGAGWHVPGGIIRFKETMAERIAQVAAIEIGSEVQYDPAPIAVREFIHDRDVRGHFISLLLRCRIDAAFMPDNTGRQRHDAGYLQWHDGCPTDLLQCQATYKKFIVAHDPDKREPSCP